MSGTLIPNGEHPAVRLERVLKDPPSVVWRALTEPEALARWFPCGVVVAGGTWRVGAKLTFPFPSDVIEMTLEGEVLVVDEPRSLAYTWGGDTLRFELHDRGDSTLLVLVNELPKSTAARNAAGWETCLDRLAGLEPRDDAWRGNFEVYTKAFEPALGPQEGPPEGYKGH
jgi:uncharacterized protein YndB with AHSA1/START domain